jgi:RHS repeat-associated protein
MTYQFTAGRLTYSLDTQYGSAHQSSFDAAGNRTMYYSQTSGKLEEAKSYYSADGMLRKVDRRVCNGDCSVERGAYEDYRYDALGRRVLVRSQRTWCNAGGDCWSNIERIIWDGDHILGEIRMPGYPNTGADTLEADTLTFKPTQTNCPPLPPPEGCNPADTLPSNAQYWGHVVYINGPAIDQPLEVIRGGAHSNVQDQFAVIPHANWNGLYDSGAFPGASLTVRWPASSTEIQRYDLDADDDPGNWVGSVIYQNRDMGGSLYMRNRYYDAATGRFTQEDPLGLAGGVNLYGFAGGDPVNFSDPFGLCPPCTNDDLGAIAELVTQKTAGLKVITDALVSVTPVGDAQQSVDAFSRGQLAAGIFHGAMATAGLIPGGGEAEELGAAVVRTEARNLAEQLTLAEAKAGAGTEIMQGKIKDAARAGWAKMQHVHTSPDGTNIVIHYWQEIKTGVTEGFKFKNP